MTANQINWFNAQEQKRHNLATEKLQQHSLRETKRHNVMGESINVESNRIQQWFNQQQAKHLERQDAINALHYSRMDTETNRHNVTAENIDSIYKARSLTLQERDVSTREYAAQQEAANIFTNRVLKGAQTDESRSKAVLNATQSALNMANIKLAEANRQATQYNTGSKAVRDFNRFLSSNGSNYWSGLGTNSNITTGNSLVVAE